MSLYAKQQYFIACIRKAGNNLFGGADLKLAILASDNSDESGGEQFM